ncbi:uncharacterized protein C8Q71DRAFT_912205 [Rhodofomes roseus]|uniref:MYND-type domain-containing protein n=1 Tax=Rhodofomes roseus TaxID=34475 RepID=A0ABQ8JX72_9APHY|nr:uncharacterized protein C8Q71DRAFT_912205 [Rhodofomes roseus]KAH9828683.1 hypothetical protein C8Q71DRAFT_912205 [Rhodofomes roseus]
MSTQTRTLHHVSSFLSFAEHDLSPDFQLTDELTDYVQLLQGCCRSYGDDVDFNDLFKEAFARLRSRNIRELSVGALAGRMEDMIELGMRLYTGCGGVVKDIPEALTTWQHITSPSSPPSQPPPRRILAIAYALQAKVYKDRAHVDKETIQIDDLRRAAIAADAAAAQGLVTPIVLNIAQYAAMPLGLPSNAYQSFKKLPEFACLTDLWRVWRRRNGEIEREQQARDRKVARAPNAYRCAAEGCGIEGTKKATLLRCAGKCEEASKPHYCSKECQKKDWKRHKRMCKPGAPVFAGVSTSNGAKTASQRSSDAVSSERSPWDEEFLPQDPGRERMITVPTPGRPGHSLQISSSMMTPAMLKDLKEEIARP